MARTKKKVMNCNKAYNRHLIMKIERTEDVEKVGHATHIIHRG